MDIVHFLSQYGYVAVVLGAMIEGESILLAAAYAVSQQYLLLWPVIACGALGAVISDHIYFYIGRTQGDGWLMRHDNVRRRAIKVRQRVQQHQTLLLAVFRFMIGFRTIIPLLLGMGGVSRWRFFIFDLVASVLWASTVTLLGHWVLRQLQHIHWRINWSDPSVWVMFMLIALSIAMVHLIWMRRKTAKP